MSRRSNPTYQIEMRQRQEDAVNKYRSVAQEHTKLKMLSSWEDKTTKKIEQNDVFRKMDHLQAQQDDILVMRRKRLAEMLRAEQEEHEQMIANLAETDDQRRERLMQRAREFRQQRDTIQKQTCQAKRDQLFREESAVLRDAQSKIKLLAVAEERVKQLEIKKERDRFKAEEDRFFHEQWIDQQRRQTQRAQSDLQTIHTRMLSTQQDLAKQVSANDKARAEAKALQAQEDAESIKQIHLGLEADARAEQARRDEQKRIAAETKKMNEELRQLKDAELEVLRQEEKEELDALVRQIAEENAAEQRRKQLAKEDAMHQMKYVEAQMNAAAQSETALDRLWSDANDKEWAKRENRWLAEQSKREALLKTVFETRAKQVEEKRAAEMTDAERRRADHEQMIQNIHTLTTQDTGDVQRRKQAAKNNEAYVLQQLAKREAEKAEIRKSKRTEMTDAQTVEHEYRDKIAYELAVLEKTKPEHFQNVKLVTKRRGISGMD